MTNINDIINTLDTIAEKNSIDVYLPCIGSTTKVKSLTTKQQKMFYTCIKDNILYNTKFIITAYDVIKENLLDKTILNILTIVDRDIILLALRKQALGTKVKKADFTNCLNNVNTIILPENKKITLDSITLELQVPLAINQYNMEWELRRNLDDIKLTLEEITQNVVINNVVKFIKEIYINDVAININNLSYADRINIAEKLPSEFLNLIQVYAIEINDITSSITIARVNENSLLEFKINADFFIDN
jgi:hypothetical protein